MKFQSFLFNVSLCVAALAAAAPAWAQAWPSKPVRIVVPFAAGSGSDQFARVIATELQAALKQPFVVENKAGAAGFIGAEFVARAAPDGYTLFVTSASIHAANPHQYKKLPYDPIRDFTPIGRICTVPHVVVVNAALPIRTIPELIAEGKKGRLTYAYGNSAGQLSSASFSALTKIDAMGVPYKSTPQAMTDVAGGQVSFMTVDLASSQALIQAGKVRAIAATTERPTALAPHLPTIAATAGIGPFEFVGWSILLAPAALPADLTRQINQELNRVLERPDMVEKIRTLGCEVARTSPAELDSFMKSQLEAFGRKFKEAGIQPE